MADQNSTIDVYYDMDIAQICAHFGKSRNTVDKAVAKLVKNYPNSGWKFKNPETRRITIKAEGVEVLSTYFRKEKHEISTVETEQKMEIEKLQAILAEKEKTIANLEHLYTERLQLELDKSRQTFLIEQKTKDDQIEEQKTIISEKETLLNEKENLINEKSERISDLESENHTLQELKEKGEQDRENLQKQLDELEEQKREFKRKEEEYNSKSFLYRLMHKF